MISKTALFIFLFLCLASCVNQKSDNTNHIFSNEKLEKDQIHSIDGDERTVIKLDSLLNNLKASLEKGIKNPMGVVTDSIFYDLIDDPRYRPEVRALLEAYISENGATMVTENEPGERIKIKGQIVDQSTGLHLSKVNLELVHADNEGFYFLEKTKWNPRLFAFLISDDNGEFFINTIRPGKYKDDDGNYVPAHVHFTLKKEGYRTFGGEFTFEDDSIFMANGNVEMVPVAKLEKDKKPKVYQVTIPMQRR